jgi:hypothetical protein
MKLKFLALVAVLAVMASCSKDDDPAPLESAKLSFGDEESVVTLPDVMLNSSNEYVSQIVEMVGQVNMLSSYTMLSETPDGATKSSTEIVPENGRIARTAGSVLVYIWDDGQGGQIAYQVKDQSDAFVFELLWKIDGKWYKYFSATEKKDKSSGNMVLYDIWNFNSDPNWTASSQLFRWDWSRSGDLLSFSFTDFESLKFEMSVNVKTGAGNMATYWGSTVNESVVWEKGSEITWESDGSGTWKDYEDGAVIAEGTFEA